jgi:hypothetical protein
MGTIYQSVKNQGLITAQPGGSINCASALIDSGKPVSAITVAPLSQDEVNTIASKLDMLYRNKMMPDLADMIAEEFLNILIAVGAVKYQTQSEFGGILAQGTQLDLWPIRPKDVGGTLLNPAATGSKGIYGGTSAGIHTWLTTGLTAGTKASLIPSQTMWQYAGMIYLGFIETLATAKMSGVQFTLAGIAAPPQPLTPFNKMQYGDARSVSFSRLEKPVIIPPLKAQLVEVQPENIAASTTGDSDLVPIALVIAQSQNKTL